MQGGEHAGYCTPLDLRNLTNITSSMLTDTAIFNLILLASRQVNAETQVYHEDEKVLFIDETKENEIDGVNKIFYVKNYPVGDSNSDYEVNVSDLTVYSIDSDGVKTLQTVTEMTPSTGKFVLDTAPISDITLEVTYYRSQVSMEDPHPLITMATTLLTASYCYMKLNVGKATRFKTPNLTVFRDMDSSDTFYLKYLKIINLINQRGIVDSVEVSEDLLI